jgi:hypothetical protein
MLEKIKDKIALKYYDELADRFYKPYNDFPFGNTPKADKKTYLSLWEEAKNETYNVVDDYEKEVGYSIDKEWMDNLALLTQIVIKESKLCYQHGRLLYSTLSQYIEENENTSINIFETGTSKGFSSICMAKTLEDRKQFGKILTLDILPNEKNMIWNCVADLEGPRTRMKLLSDYKDLLDKYLIYLQCNTFCDIKRISWSRIHFAFLDAQHTYDYLEREFLFVEDKQLKGDIIFFDDYTPSLFPEVVEFVDKACPKYNYNCKKIQLTGERGYVIAVKQ